MLTIYYHMDFDGIVAASLFSIIMTKLNIHQKFIYIPVDYGIKNSWNRNALNKPCAVLDFLYHDDADYYYDHHSTSFLGLPVRRVGRGYEDFRWDPNFKSTPSLLVDTFKDKIDFEEYNELIIWSDIIDSAAYSKPEDVYNNTNPYILLNKLISYFINNGLNDNIGEVIPIIINSDIHLFLEKYSIILDSILQKERLIMDRLRDKMIIEKNICFFDQSVEKIEYQRYLPYYYFPCIDYTVGIYKKDKGYSISIGYNPWKSNNSVNLGKIAEKFNGGGRNNVAGILIDSMDKGLEIVRAIISELTSIIGKE